MDSEIADPLSFFDKGVTIAVLAAVAIAGTVLVRRWLKAMDKFEERDKAHLSAIETQREQCHKENMAMQQERIVRDERTAVVLDAISETLKILQTEITRR